MSGAVRRLCAGWFGAAGFCVEWIDMSGSKCGCAENVPPDHDWMEHEAEREIEDDADDNRCDVVLQSAFGNRQAPRIAAVFEGDPIIDGPGQHRSEQDDRPDIAVDQEMPHRPGF